MNVAAAPLQILATPLITAIGLEFTLIVAVSVSVQPLISVAVTL
jgi:hypothetical protein